MLDPKRGPEMVVMSSAAICIAFAMGLNPKILRGRDTRVSVAIKDKIAAALAVARATEPVDPYAEARKDVMALMRMGRL